MIAKPRTPEIDHRTIKLTVGLIALSLAGLTSFFAQSVLESISASYYEGALSPPSFKAALSQNIFIGFLYAISALMLSYNGLSASEMVLSKIAAVLALGVALFPCGCDKGIYPMIIGKIHYASAAILFLILAFFCYLFRQRARRKGHAEANARSYIYVISGITILASVLVLAINALGGEFISAKVPRLVFYGERTGLIAFGISWLTASRVLPFLARDDERLFSKRDQTGAHEEVKQDAVAGVCV